MRKLQSSDLFAALRVIKKANLKEELKPIIKKAAEGKLDVQDIGIEGVLSVVEIMTEKKAEHAIYEVLAGPFEMKVDEVEKMDLITLA